jgi:signal peptidase I
MSYATPTDTPDTPKKRESLGGWLRFLLTFAVLAWILRSLIVAPFSIPSGSMLPNLLIGDYVMVAKWPYGYSRYSFPFAFPSYEGRIFDDLPERGDVVVFKLPGNERVDFIKRVIGLPGDTIEVRGGMLIVNGKAAPRERISDVAVPISANSPCKVVGDAIPMVVSDGQGGQFCRYATYRETLPGGRNYLVLDQVENPRADDFGPVTVPAGFLFLMGDNRDDSLDSRFGVTEGGIGFVPVENLVGRGLFNFWSTDGSANYLLPWTWFSALRADRIGKGTQS